MKFNDDKEIVSPVTASILLLLYDNGSLTTSEIAEILGLRTEQVSPYLYYYYKVKGWVTRNSFAWTLTQLGRSIVLKYKDYFKRLSPLYSLKSRYKVFNSSDYKDLERSIKISKDKILSKKLEKLFENIMGLGVDLSREERLIIEKLLEWKVKRGKWYVCAESPEELSELLNINIDVEALKHLEKLGIIYRYYDRRNKQHCFRVSRTLLN